MLQARARMLADIRAFFAQRGVLEVETPALSHAGTTDPAIHSLATQIGAQRCYLHTSPEFPMKRLLVAGSGDIYQICKVFRDGESGRYHNPEFTLLEWYRLGVDHLSLAEEVCQLIVELDQNRHKITFKTIEYRDIFKSFTGFDPLDATETELQQLVQDNIPNAPRSLNRNACLDLLMSACIAPALPHNRLTIITDYPASQAALARLNPDGKTAARFEVFWGSLELANGFHELQDADEQRQRFAVENRQRREQGLPEILLDENFLAALEQGLPDCSGVALGLDRLLMRLEDREHIDEVLAFPFARS